MPPGPYRDPLAAVRERVKLLELEVERLSGQVSPVELALVPEEIATRVDELRARAEARPEPTLAAWTEHEAVLEGLVRALGDAWSAAPPLELANRPPTLPVPRGTQPYLIEEAVHLRLRQQVEAELAHHAKRVKRTRWGDDAYTWRFSLDGVTLRLYARSWVGNFSETAMDLAACAAMPDALGPLVVGTASWWHGETTRALLGDVELGEREFDAAYRVHGPARQARALLGPGVRRKLMPLAKSEARLELAEGLALLGWRLDDVPYDAATLGVLAACRALVAMREVL